MMRFASMVCNNPSCRRSWEADARDDQNFSECPDCKQMATVPGDSPRVMDLCERCHKAADDHCWEGELLRCRS